MTGRKPPWHYDREDMPTKWTLRRWRRVAMRLARKVGAKRACHFCKRPMNQWGTLAARHPRSYGNQRVRIMCTACANLILHMLDILEWFGAEDHLPAEEWQPGEMPPASAVSHMREGQVAPNTIPPPHLKDDDDKV